VAIPELTWTLFLNSQGILPNTGGILVIAIATVLLRAWEGKGNIVVGDWNKMTFEPRPVAAKAWKALDRVVAANEAMREAEAKRARQARKRANAIEDARRHGLSLDAIAQRLGVSRERVRQMAAKRADKG
jgi:DNA-binding transcriptional regulator YiaG